jgi:predicted SnoaL-like aldol condensation-catalyzing enzyme
MAGIRTGLVLIVASALAACATTGAAMRSAAAQQNTAVVLAFLDTVYNKHEVAQAFRLYVAPHYQQHRRGAPEGNEAAIQALTRMTHELYPGIRQEVKRTVAQGDLVAVHSRYIRNQVDRDSGGGQAAVDIFRLEHNRIVEHWDVVEDAAAGSTNDNEVF